MMGDFSFCITHKIYLWQINPGLVKDRSVNTQRQSWSTVANKWAIIAYINLLNSHMRAFYF